MKLFILEGCHASGKTTILDRLKKENYDIVIKNENYFNLTRFKYGTILHQCDWLLNWLEDIIEMKNKGYKKVICDRGPITSIIYGGIQYQFIIDEIYRTLEKHNIVIIDLILKCPEIDEHKQRIIKRNSPLVELELKNLEKVRETYDILCINYKKVLNFKELYEIIKD